MAKEGTKSSNVRLYVKGTILGFKRYVLKYCFVSEQQIYVTFRLSKILEEEETLILTPLFARLMM